MRLRLWHDRMGAALPAERHADDREEDRMPLDREEQEDAEWV